MGSIKSIAKSGVFCCLAFLFLAEINLHGQNNQSLNFFSGNEIYSITETKKAIWVATECKIVEMDKSTGALNFHVHKKGVNCYQYWNYSLIADTADHIWLAGNDGLFKYDGDNWIEIDDTSYVDEIMVDKNNNLWYYGAQGFKKYKQDSKLKYEVQVSPVICDFDSKGNMWMLGFQGILKLGESLESTRQIPNSDSSSINLNCLVIDSLDRIWVGGYTRAPKELSEMMPFLAVFDGLNWTVHKIADLSPVYSGVIDKIQIDKDQNVWCQVNNALVKFNGKSWTVIFKNEQLGRGIELHTFYIDPLRNIWLGTRGDGLLKSDSLGWIKKTMGNSDLPGNNVGAIEVDKNGILWVGTSQSSPNFSRSDNGFAKFDGVNWTNFTDQTSGIPSSARMIMNDYHGNMWVANQWYLYKYDGLKWSKQKVDFLNVYSMAIDSLSHIWSASSNLKEYNGKDWLNHFYDEFGTENIGRSLVVNLDRNRNLWVASDNWVAKYNGNNNWSLFKSGEANGLYFSVVNAISFDSNNNLWLGSAFDGLIKFDGRNYYQYNTNKKGTSKHVIYSLGVDDENNVWIGTFDNGLLKYDGENWVQFTTQNSDLLSNSITAIEIDRQQIWLGSTSGLTKFQENGGDTIKVTEKVFTDVSDIEYHDKTVSVFPNPFTNEFTISGEFLDETKMEFELYKLNGALIKRFEKISDGNRWAINMERNYQKGLYIGLLKTKYGNQLIKLIKE